MQQPVWSDVVMLARSICELADNKRLAAVKLAILTAKKAQEHRKLTGRVHPVFGSGTIQSAIGDDFTGREPKLTDPAYNRSLRLVLKLVRES
jgi:hypothetical protein